MSVSSKKILGFDSLRFFACLAVFFYHATNHLPWGHLGVDFFFVLSSFLLSFLALQEIEKTGAFSRWNFFVRRALRIFPLYYLIVGISLFLVPVVAAQFGYIPSLPEEPWYYWLFLSNYEASDHVFPLKFLWSIAVEEQFYMLFLLLSPLFSRNFAIPVFLLLVAYVGYMVAAPNYDWPMHVAVFPHFINFGSGMILAWLYHKGKTVWTWGAAIFVLSLIALVVFDFERPIMNVFLSSLFCGLIVVTMSLGNSLKEFRLFRFTEFWGKYSYGLYVYSGWLIVFGQFFGKDLPAWLNVSLQFTGLCVVSFLSYHLYEKHFLALKERFRVNKG